MGAPVQKVSIAGFQSLAKVKIDLEPFTVLVGQSNIGKSAIMRAIRYAVQNQTGQDFIRTGADAAGVGLRFEDGDLIWIKGGSTEYRYTHDGETEVYQKMGASVPPAIEKGYRLGPILIGDEKVMPNFHGQWELPFLLDASPIMRAKLLGRLSGVDKLHLAIQAAKNSEQQTRSKLKVRIEDVTRIEDALDQTSDIMDIYSRLCDLEERVAKVQKTYQALQLIVAKVEEIKNLRRSVVQLKGQQATLSTINLDEAGELLIQVGTVISKAQEVRGLTNEIDGLRVEVDRDTKEISQIEAVLETVKTCPTCGQPLRRAHAHS